MDPYVKLAKDTIETYIRSGEIYEPSKYDLPDEMLSTRAGAFVSIHKGEDLRGCIGIVTSKGPWGVDLNFPVPGQTG